MGRAIHRLTHDIDRGTEGAGASFRVWEGRTTFPGLGLSNVMLSSRLGEPKSLRRGGDRARRSTRVALTRNLTIGRCSLRRGMAWWTAAVMAYTIFTATEDAEERSTPPSSSAWGGGRLFLRIALGCKGTKAGLGHSGLCLRCRE